METIEQVKNEITRLNNLKNNMESHKYANSHAILNKTFSKYGRLLSIECYSSSELENISEDLLIKGSDVICLSSVASEEGWGSIKRTKILITLLDEV